MAKTRYASRLRLRLLKQLETLRCLAEVSLGNSELLPGSFYERRRRCGRPQCRCARGHLHRGMVLATGSKGRRRVVSLAGTDLDVVESSVLGYRRLRHARADMAHVFEEVVKTFDELGRLRCMDARDFPRAGVR